MTQTALDVCTFKCETCKRSICTGARAINLKRRKKFSGSRRYAVTHANNGWRLSSVRLVERLSDGRLSVQGGSRKAFTVTQDEFKNLYPFVTRLSALLKLLRTVKTKTNGRCLEKVQLEIAQEKALCCRKARGAVE